MSDEQRPVAVKGVASIVVTSVEMGNSDDETRRQVLAWMQATGYIDASFLLEVATAIAKQAQPFDWPVEDQEQRRQIERMLGVVGSSDQLLVALRARELVT
ncbi:hypothetical protein, partial [Modestobacter marinus]